MVFSEDEGPVVVERKRKQRKQLSSSDSSDSDQEALIKHVRKQRKTRSNTQQNSKRTPTSTRANIGHRSRHTKVRGSLKVNSADLDEDDSVDDEKEYGEKAGEVSERNKNKSKQPTNKLTLKTEPKEEQSVKKEKYDVATKACDFETKKEVDISTKCPHNGTNEGGKILMQEKLPVNCKSELLKDSGSGAEDEIKSEQKNVIKGAQDLSIKRDPYSELKPKCETSESAVKVKEEETSCSDTSEPSKKMEQQSENSSSSDDETLAAVKIRESGQCQEQKDPGSNPTERAAEKVPLKPTKWRVVCSSLQDWQELTESFRKARLKCERELYKILSGDFLPELPQIFEQKVSPVFMFCCSSVFICD